MPADPTSDPRALILLLPLAYGKNIRAMPCGAVQARATGKGRTWWRLAKPICKIWDGKNYFVPIAYGASTPAHLFME